MCQLTTRILMTTLRRPVSQALLCQKNDASASASPSTAIAMIMNRRRSENSPSFSAIDRFFTSILSPSFLLFPLLATSLSIGPLWYNVYVYERIHQGPVTDICDRRLVTAASKYSWPTSCHCGRRPASDVSYPWLLLNRWLPRNRSWRPPTDGRLVPVPWLSFRVTVAGVKYLKAMVVRRQPYETSATDMWWPRLRDVGHGYTWHWTLYLLYRGSFIYNTDFFPHILTQ